MQPNEKRISKQTLEKIGKYITFICTIILAIIVFTIILMVAQRGLSTFFADGVNPLDFLLKTKWLPSSVDENGQSYVGALPMIIGSVAVTLLSAIFATPFAVGAAIFMVEISPKFGKKVLQPVIELLVGIPSVVYGLIGLTMIVPMIRGVFGGTGFGILSASIVLAIMILPTMTSLTVDALQAVPQYYRQGALGLGATRWQMIYKVVLRSAKTGILTALVMGMTRAFGEAMAVQMVIGNTAIVPNSFITPASTVTSILTLSMGNTITGTLENNVLWTLALVLLCMSIIFIFIVKRIGRKG
ncbi:MULTISPECIES: phosphate ABC transporter permease subunit PstC [unclassified Granulicatella]|uniref:phosphate ABC transporter permease subunit PstC n=1 Tax=unclassified Granulicatella TaxID=2630493 RepID=UPI001073002A|nr:MULTISPECIES: phosphate ABC transporter permease subunit PstC [unclassified Granulicatella]MBF0780143.1 phosphate ABC transporter permease subunit PstC [Granulicatella sp. 19428wC4_WM01]TFU95747.1 phosphate ABC transporter permease subunit PstC [Granulicatella sp. WM01]